MTESDLVLNQSDLLELAEAVKVIERHYPDRELRLVRKNGAKTVDVKRESASAKTQVSRRSRKGDGNNRAKVAEATRGRWLTLAQICEATGLGKRQVHGAMLNKDGPYVFERRIADEEVPNGPKEYRLQGT